MTTQQRDWGGLMQNMVQLEQELVAIAPDCELTRAEAARYLGRLLRYAIGRYIDRSSSPVRPRLSYETARVGGDNPDYRYCIADLDGSLRYRLSGRMNDTYRLGIGTYSGGLGAAHGLQCTGYVNVDSQVVDRQGHFEFFLSVDPNSPFHLSMSSETNSIIVRQLVLDPLLHRPAAMEIECLSGTEHFRAEPIGAADLRSSIARANQFLTGTVRQFIGWTSVFVQFPNTLLPLAPALLAAAQGDPSTLYYNGYYRLRPSEALIIEFTPPPCDYWNLQACNHWLESLDVLDQPAHINHYMAKPNKDGLVRAVITPECPNVNNWIDTVGHREGCLAMRWVGLAEGHRPPTLHCYVSPIDQIER